MLILGRRKGQAIIIGEGSTLVEIEIMNIQGGTVSLGIKADKLIPVHRKEIYEVIQKERKNGPI